MPTIPKYAKKRSIKPLIELTADQYLRFRILCMQDHKSMNAFLKEVIVEQIQRMPEIPLAHYGPHREDYGKPRPARRKKRISSSHKKRPASKVASGSKAS